ASASSTSTATVADAALNATVLTLSPTEGVALDSVAVATFTDANPAAPVSDCTAAIAWDDGTPTSSGTITQPGGAGTAFPVPGSHTYGHAPGPTLLPYTTLFRSASASSTSTATVADAALNATVHALSPTEGLALSNVQVATFT